MTVNSVNNVSVNRYFQPFKRLQSECKKYFICCNDNKTPQNQNSARNYSNIGFIAGLLLLCTSQFEHSPNLTRFEKFGVGLLLLSTFSLLYQSYKVGKQSPEELEESEDDVCLDTYV